MMPALEEQYWVRPGMPTELRAGPLGIDLSVASNEIITRIPLSQFFDAIAVRIDANKADGKVMILNFVFSDAGETHVVSLENSVMNHWQREADPAADATINSPARCFPGPQSGSRPDATWR